MKPVSQRSAQGDLGTRCRFGEYLTLPRLLRPLRTATSLRACDVFLPGVLLCTIFRERKRQISTGSGNRGSRFAPVCYFSDQQYSNGWLTTGATTPVRYNQNTSKKSTAKANNKLGNRENFDVEMAASVLPARNAYNDYHVKYHSVSGGSALSQSMKYAEAWLNCTVNGHSKKKNCRKCASQMKSLACIQGFGTVRNRRVYRNLICNATGEELATYADPYDIVRQSRLSGIQCGTVRAKSYSPSKRKHCAPLMTTNRLPSPDVQTSVEDNGRKSILECSINPYDLVKRSPEEDGCSLMSDDDILDVSSFTKPYDKSDSTNGISIAGQKIRVFSTPNKPDADIVDDWISDPIDDPEDLVKPNDTMDAEQTPKRPPRRKSTKVTPKSEPALRSNAIYQNYRSIANMSLPPLPPGPAPTPPSAPVSADIKSILKKPLATSSEIDSDVTESTTGAGKLNNCVLPPDKNSPSGDTGKNFYLTTFNNSNTKQTDSRKVKKQVQFKGMQEQTVEDESGSKSIVDSPMLVLAETGYDTENATATPVQRRYADRTLFSDDKSNATDQRHLHQDHELERNISSSTPLSQPIIDDRPTSAVISKSSLAQCTTSDGTCKSGEW
ncbi:hypothetical protein U1Q18_049117 [Sarracenia purpurea var. burkii]